MEISSFVRRGNTLHVTFDEGASYVCNSSLIMINECVNFQVKVLPVRIEHQTHMNYILVRFFKNHSEDDYTYSITLSSNKLCIVEKSFLTDDGTWHLIMENYKYSSFDISVVMDTVHINSFKALQDDTELTDFELRGEDGSVKVHKAALAASSHVLRRMLSGSWRETTVGHVDLKGTSAQTLQHFKDYVYLGKLPNTGLEQILLFASYYMISELEQKCVNKLVSSLTAQSTYNLLQFAMKNEVSKLYLAILDWVENKGVEVKDMHPFFSNCKDNNCEE